MPVVGLLFIVLECRERLSKLSVGQSSFRDGLFIDFLGSLDLEVVSKGHFLSAENHSLALPSASLSSHVFFRRGQTRQWGSHLAESHGASLSLRNPAVADARCLVFSSTTWWLSGYVRFGDVFY